MSYQLVNAKVWDGSAWVQAAGGGGAWFENEPTLPIDEATATVTADTTAHTKGAWSELIASTSANADALFLWVTGVGAASTNTATLIDVGTGAAGSETVIAGNIAVGGAIGVSIPLALQIPSGTRVACRIQSAVTGGKTATVYGQIFDLGYEATETTVDVLSSSNTATSAGLTMPSSSLLAQIVASTTRAYRAIVVVPSINNANINTYAVTYSVAVGASGSETDVYRIFTRTTSNEFVTSDLRGRLAIGSVSIPAGTRLSIRHNLPAIGGDRGRYAVTVIGIP